MLDEHLAKLEQGKWKDAPAPDVTPPHGDPFEEQYRKRMSELGRKGGKVSGAKRMEMPAKKRRDIALKAAKARWGSRQK
jgi:general stress protein YciG